MNKADITPELVAILIAEQFPQWADLPVEPVELDGWDNTTYRLGSTMSVRLPSADAYVPQVDKEHRWLPQLARCVPLPIPEPLAIGVPSARFPRPWSVYRWLEGVHATVDRVHDLAGFAADLARFLAGLYSCDPAEGPPAGQHSFFRGGPVNTWDEQTRAAIMMHSSVVDTDGATKVWEAALAASPEVTPVWVHGDVTGANLLVCDGQLSGVIDFGCSAVGDPACDTTIAWTFFSGDSRSEFMKKLPVDEGTWARGRGWALWKALIVLPEEQINPAPAARFGWQFSSQEVVSEIIEDYRLHYG